MSLHKHSYCYEIFKAENTNQIRMANTGIYKREHEHLLFCLYCVIIVIIVFETRKLVNGYANFY